MQVMYLADEEKAMFFPDDKFQIANEIRLLLLMTMLNFILCSNSVDHFFDNVYLRNTKTRNEELINTQ